MQVEMISHLNKGEKMGEQRREDVWVWFSGKNQYRMGLKFRFEVTE